MSNTHYNNAHPMSYDNHHNIYPNGSYTPHNGFDASQPEEQPAPPLTNDPSFDILEWHPAYQSCQRYFLDHAQHEPGTQALCALINIRLPTQWLQNPIHASTAPPQTPATNQFHFNSNPYPSKAGPSNLPSPQNHSSRGPASNQATPVFVSLIPYLRRLVITGFDKTAILHGFFGDDYARGILPHLDCERRNYLFAAKHGGWRTCKKQYDTGSGGGAGGCVGDESVPFMKPLDGATGDELGSAEKAWSGWLAMEDWMVGPRAPEEGSAGSGQRQQQGQHQRQGVNGETGLLPDGVGERFGQR